jgi:hypothetical protein
VLDVLFELELQARQRLREGIRLGLDDQDVVGPHLAEAVRRRYRDLLPYEADDLRLGLMKRRLDLPQRHPGGLGVFGYARFRQVGAGLEAVRPLALPTGHHAPADQDEEGQAGRSHGHTNRREVEHREARPGHLSPKAGNDEIGGRPDQCRHATENGSE